MRRSAFVAAAYIGAVIGAGFGSGREVLQFFAAYGRSGLVGAALAGVLFALLGTLLLRRAVHLEPDGSYAQLLRDVCGAHFGSAMDAITSVFLFAGLAVVIAGGAAVLGPYGLSPWVAGLIWALGLAVAALGGGSLLLWSNFALLPVIIGYALFAAWYAHLTTAGPWTAERDPAVAVGNWATGATLYVAYNTVLAVATLTAAARRLRSAAEATAAGIMGGVGLGALCLLVTFALLPSYQNVSGLPLPLGAVFPAGSVAAQVYPLCLGAALWTTGAAILVALAPKLSTRPWLPVIPPLAALPVAQIGLAGLVRRFYPVMGYAGLPLLLLVVVRALRRDPG